MSTQRRAAGCNQANQGENRILMDSKRRRIQRRKADKQINRKRAPPGNEMEEWNDRRKKREKSKSKQTKRDTQKRERKRLRDRKHKREQSKGENGNEKEESGKGALA